MIALLLAAQLLGQSDADADSAWTRVGAEVSLAQAVDVRETHWMSPRPPGGPYDRIELHRYRGAGPFHAALLYLPGTHMNGETGPVDEDHNLWIFLARRGVEVFALDYRTHFVPADYAGDFGFMRDWGIEAFVSDVRAAAAKARVESGRTRLFVGGFSRGVALAYAYATSEPETVAGLVALDGSFKSHAPKDRYDFAEEARKLEASGAFASDVAGRLGWERRQRLMEAAAADPKGPATEERFATVGDELAELLYRAWRPGGLANALGGFSRPQVLARLLAGYNRYYPAIQDVEGRSIADRDDDPRTGLDDGWAELDVPLVYFGSTGMGGEWLLNGIYSADRSGSSDVTLHVLEGYGHLDVVVGERARREVFEPVHDWIRRRTEARRPPP